MRLPGGKHQEHGRTPHGLILRNLLPWAPTLLGVCTLIALLVFAATRFTSPPEPRAVTPAQPFLPVPGLSPEQLTSGSLPPGSLPAGRLPAGVRPSIAGPSSFPANPAAGPGQAVRPANVPTTPGRPTRTASRAGAAPAPTPGPVSGRYRVMDSYSDAFIGEVLVVNSAGRDSDWRVELRFPAAVGDLVTSWVESAPQATLRRSGDSYIWTSGVPVPARSQVALRFHFKRSGSGNLPSTCTVNGTSCAGLR